jgi:predicted metalloprotease with PDZ domain
VRAVIDKNVLVSGLLWHGAPHMLLARRKAGDSVEIHAFRRDELMRFDVRLRPAVADQCRLTLQAKPPEGVSKLRRGWIGA